DPRAGLHETVGGAQHAGDLVEPERHVMQPAGNRREVGDHGEVVAALAGRQHAEDRQVGRIVEHRPFHEAEAERVAIPSEIIHDIGAGDRHVVEAARRDAARRVALRTVWIVPGELRRRLEPFRLPIHLLHGAARRAPRVLNKNTPPPPRAALPPPPAPAPAAPPPRPPPLPPPAPPPAPPNVPDPPPPPRREHQLVMQVRAPSAQVDGVTLARR